MARVIGLLQRDQGATLAELIAATDWLPHTTRAALTGLRKRGYVVALDRSDKERGSTYSIPRGSNLASEKPTASAIEPPDCPSGSPDEGQPIEEVGTGGGRRRGSGGLTMARRLPIDGGGSNSPPASASSGASPLDALIASFADLDADQLRLQWRNHLGGTPPTHLPRWLLARVLAQRLQAATLGDLDKATLRVIRQTKGGDDDSIQPPVRPSRPRDERRGRPEGGRAAGSRMERRAATGDGAGRRALPGTARPMAVSRKSPRR